MIVYAFFGNVFLIYFLICPEGAIHHSVGHRPTIGVVIFSHPEGVKHNVLMEFDVVNGYLTCRRGMFWMSVFGLMGFVTSALVASFGLRGVYASLFRQTTGYRLRLLFTLQALRAFRCLCLK